jgi:putative NADPH-quinone reductase
MRVLLFILLFMPAMLRAQVVDSLQKQLQSALGSDRILLLNELCYQLMYENPNQAIDYGNEALQLALRQDDSLLLAQTYNDFSMPYLVTGNLDSVLVLNQLSYAIRMRNGAPGQAASNLSKNGSGVL